MLKQKWVAVALATATFSFGVQANELSNLRDLQIDLLERFDLLQQEVQMLRGMIEEQAVTIDSLQQDGRNRYLDLDSRIGALQSQPAPMSEVVAASSASQVEAVVPAVELGDPAQESAEYQAAFGLIRERKFDDAQDALLLFGQRFPAGALRADAQFWLAQVYDAQGKPGDAISAFTRLLTEHPDYRRATQAELKLGRLQLVNGFTADGQQTLGRLIERAPESSEATQARDLLTD
ncbi:YbgF trimerization domain-containing protein [Litorivicinus lipolyticus]|uniref:YbgF trimerization domain-containing protein n=1 Tax=Litorivicinus lipolyticus TaxID=418701 RepID=UPI003B5B983E